MSNLHHEIESSHDDAAATLEVVTCPSCRTRWRVAQGAPAGLRCRCSRCEQVFSAGDAKTPYRVRRSSADGVEGAPAPAAAQFAPRTGDLRVGMDDPSLADRLGRTALQGGADRKAWTWTVVADPESTEDGPTATPADGDGASVPVVEVACEASVVETGPTDGPDADPEELPGGPASLLVSPLEPLAEAIERARDPESAATPALGEVPEVGDPPALDEIVGVVQDDVEVEPVDAGDAVGAEPEPSPGPERNGRPGPGTLAVVTLTGAGGALAGWTWTPWLTAATNDVLTTWPATAGTTVPADPAIWVGVGAVFGLLLGWGWLRWTLRRR